MGHPAEAQCQCQSSSHKCSPDEWQHGLVGGFGFNGPLKQYFSLYRAVSQKEEERGEKSIGEYKCPNSSHPHLLRAQ